MFKVIFWVSICCIVVLLIMTIVLVWMNRSPKVYNPIVTGLLIGTTTSFAAILFMLKETEIEKSFATFILVNEKSKLPAHIKYNTHRKYKRLNQYALLTIRRTVNGKPVYLFDPPSTHDETATICQEALQYILFKEIVTMQKEGTEITLGRGSASGIIRKPLKVSDAVKTNLMEYKSFATNRFSVIATQGFTRGDTTVTFPEGTTVEFLTVAKSETNPIQHKIILHKRYFFTVEITISKIAIVRAAYIPFGLEVSPHEGSTNTFAYSFLVSLKAKFERLTSANERSVEYLAWVDWVFRNIEILYSDEE